MISQDRRLMVPDCFGNPLAFARLMNHSREVLEDDVVLEKRARVLRNRVKEPSKRRPRFAVQRMRMRCRDDIGARVMDARMNRERGKIHRPVAFHDFALLIHEDQVRSADLPEMHAEGSGCPVDDCLSNRCVPRKGSRGEVTKSDYFWNGWDFGEEQVTL